MFWIEEKNDNTLIVPIFCMQPNNTVIITLFPDRKTPKTVNVCLSRDL